MNRIVAVCNNLLTHRALQTVKIGPITIPLSALVWFILQICIRYIQTNPFE